MIPAFERLKKGSQGKGQARSKFKTKQDSKIHPKTQSSMIQSEKCSLLFVYLNTKSLNLSIEPEVTIEARKVERDHGKGETNSRGGI